MRHTRILFTDSTTAECSTVLKMFDFEEDTKNGFFLHQNKPGLRVYLLWGRSPYHPEIVAKLPFVPRVQLHFKTKDEEDSLDSFAREAAIALRSLDPGTKIRLFNAESGLEVVA